MAIRVDGVLYDELTADPGLPVEGQTWYNTTAQEFRIYRNGIVENIIVKTVFDAHVNDTLNPHDTTLEQARAENNLLAGDINLGGNTITNVAQPTAPGEVAEYQWTIDQITARLRGLDWQESVLSFSVTSSPGSPTLGDRYIVSQASDAIVAVNTTTEQIEVVGDITGDLDPGDTFDIFGSTGNDGTYTINTIVFNSPNTEIVVNEDITDGTVDGDILYSGGDWNGQTDNIAEYDGAAWTFDTPNEGYATSVEDENILYIHDGASWNQFGSVIDHGSLLGLGDNDHPQYLLRDGSNALTGDLNAGGQDITNVNLVDGVDVSAHASRHITGGADEIDGDQLDIDFSPSNYTPSTAPPEATNLDHLSAHLAGIDDALSAQALNQKAGRVLAGSFSGNPKTITVTFSSAFPDNNYAVALTARTDTAGRTFNPVVVAQTSGGFDISLGSNSTTNLIHVGWIAMKDGESL